MHGGGGSSGPNPDDLYVRDASSFWSLADAFYYSSTDVFNAEESFRAAAGNAGGAFGDCKAEAAYADSFRQAMAALDNVQRAFDEFAGRVNTAGVALTGTDAAIGKDFTP